MLDTGQERGIEIAVGIGGFVGTGLLLREIGRMNCPPRLSPTGDIFGNLPAPPNPLMCALGGANDTLLGWGVAAVLVLVVMVFWEIRFAVQRRQTRAQAYPE